jgi:hypothetical protein
MPVAVGQRASRSLTTAEVVSMHPSKPVTELRVNVTRGDGTTVLEGVARRFVEFHENWGDRAKTQLLVPAA